MNSMKQLNTNAVAYVEQHYGDVPLLERERERLCAALTSAWHSDNYAQVISLVAGLAYLVGRSQSYDAGERILFMGIQASRCLNDKQHYALFLNRLAGLRCVHDRFEQALQAWQESVAIAQTEGYPAYLWEPLCHVAHTVDLLSAYGLTQRFTETMLQAKKVDDPRSVLIALFIRGFYARIIGHTDEAHNDLNTCLHLLLQQEYCSSPTAAYTHFFQLEVETELARTHGEYGRAKGYGEAAIALAQTFCDPYTVTALLFDQAYFAYQQDMFEDAYRSVRQLLDASEPVAASHHSRGGKYMLGLLTNRLSAPRLLLSRREHAVLNLVAEGLSNQEIALQLVITVGTVKKHIEHIYIKLDACSRTQAIAKARALQLLP